MMGNEMGNEGKEKKRGLVIWRKVRVVVLSRRYLNVAGAFAVIILISLALAGLGGAVASAAGAGKNGPSSPAAVTLEVTNPYRFSVTDFPCTAKVYFSEGQVFERTLSVINSEGEPVPFQLLGYLTYPDGSLMSATLIFAATVNSNSTSDYFVESSSATAFQGDIAYLGANGSTYQVNNGVFSFSIPVHRSPGMTNLTLDANKISVLGLPFAGPMGESGSPANLTATLVTDGPEMVQFALNGSSGPKFSSLITVFRGFPVVYYSVSGSGISGAEWRPLGGYLNSTLFSDLVYPGSKEAISGIGPTGVAFPPETVYTFSGIEPLSLVSNSSFQFFAVAVSEPVLAYAYQAQGSFAAYVMPGLGEVAASELYGAIVKGLEVNVIEPPAILSISYPSSAQAFQRFQVEVDLYFPSNQSEVVLSPHLPYGLVVLEPGATVFKDVKPGTSNSSYWVLYSNKTGTLSGYFQAGSSVVNFSVNFYVQPLLPPVNVALEPMSGTSPLPGVTLEVAGPGLSETVVTNSSGLANLSLPVGVYSVSVYRGELFLGRDTINVFSPGVYQLRTTSVELTVVPVFENGAPMEPPNSPLFVVYGKGGTPEFSSLATFVDGKEEARFDYLAPGPYYVMGLMWGIQTKPVEVYLNESRTVVLPIPGMVPLNVRVLSLDGRPVSGAVFQLYGPGGIFLGQESTGPSGRVGLAVPASNYTYMVTYEGYPVAQGSISVVGGQNLTVRALVSLTRIRVYSVFGPVAGAKVSVLTSSGSPIYTGITNSSGEVSVLLPRGNFSVSASTSVYSAYAPVRAPVSDVYLSAGFGASLVILVVLVVLGWGGYVALEVRGGTRKEEIAKLKGMLQKLDELYESGEVEFSLYNKLKDEYQGRLAELTQHES